MTARSFTEALRIGDPYADSEPIHATWCVAASFVVGEECDCPAATIKALIADRERAIRWAVTLEGQLAAVEARIKHWDEALGDNDYMLPRWVAADLRMAMGATFEEACAAALTGSTE